MENYHNYLMLMKTKGMINPSSSSSSMYSWELSHVWPPRLYSCSFCRRKFQSAQALGGHMNVHRRDRAKLKQSNSPSQEINLTFSELKMKDQVNTRKLDLVDSHDQDEEVVMCKRNKKSGVNYNYSPLKPFLNCSSSREEIDLELRLGDPPAVK